MNGAHDEQRQQRQSDGLRPAPPPGAVGRSQHQHQHHSQHHTSRRQHNQMATSAEPAAFDIKQHPAAVSYAASHPNRTIPKFGPYILLQTLGEGEFGKVKLGLHSHWAEEVAVKLIRLGNLESDVRMQKIRREIAVLESLHHPNIVRLYETIETEKYIGIILDYASGGELFDHILAHRYLREKDARKLFAQLISAVWYIHQKKIVHRDLKLENLLLDRNRNIIVTDFGFANRFEHKSDDLMQTSCGSPCYAAPELVISEGMYVGSAVDIWSCGVILYAMLAGYLPFDDDPENPEGDNIQQLYRYILNTPLTFPDHVSAEARDLLHKMLVPDPTQRATLVTVMEHPWLAPYSHLFEHSVEESERLSKEMQEQKKHMYRKQMREREKEMLRQQRALQQTRERHQTHHIEPSTSSRDGRQQAGLYDPISGQGERSRRAVASAIVMPSSQPEDDHPLGMAETDPFALAPSQLPVDVSRDRKTSTRSHNSKKGRPPTADNIPTSNNLSPTNINGNGAAAATGKSGKKAGGFRHTIQLEYDDGTEMQPDPPTPPRPSSRSQRVAAEQQQRMELDMSNLDLNGTQNVGEYDPKSSPVQQSPSRHHRRSSTTQRPSIPIPAVPAIPPSSFTQTARRGSNPSPVLLRNAATDPGPAYGEWETSESSTSAAITPLNGPPVDRDPIIMGSSPANTGPEKTVGQKQSEDKSRPASSSGKRHTRGISIDRIVGFGKLITGQGKESKDPINANGTGEHAGSSPNTKKTKRSSSRIGRKNTEPVLVPGPPAVVDATASKTSVVYPATEESSTTVGIPAASNDAPSVAPAGTSTTEASSTSTTAAPSAHDMSLSESTSGSVKSKKRAGRALSLMVDPISKIKEHRSKNRVSVTVGGQDHREEEVREEKEKGRKAKAISTPLNSHTEKGPFHSATDISSAHAKAETGHEKPTQAGWRLPLFRDTSQRAQPQQPVPPAAVTAMPMVTSPTEAYANDGIVTPNSGMSGSQSMRVTPTAATTKSQGVMDWFRKKSLAKERRRAGSSAEPPTMPIPIGPVDVAYSDVREGDRAKTPTQFDAQEEARTPTKTSFTPSRGGKGTPSVIITAAAEPMNSSNSQYEGVGSSSMAPSRMDRVVGAIKNVTSPLPAVPQIAVQKRTAGASSGGSVGGSSSGGQSLSKVVLRLHDGPVDPSTVSSAPPQEVIAKVLDVLREMGIQYMKESEWKYRCVRPKRRKMGIGREPSGSGSVGHAAGSAMNGLDKRGLPMTSSTSFANAPSNVFKYIMRRSSSQAPSPPNFGAGAPVAFDEDAIDLGSPAHDLPTSGSGDGQQSRVEPIYGGKPDQHDEVLFSVEVTKLDRLDDLLSLDIRRLKGNLKSYKFLYDIIRERCNLQR